MLHIVCYLMSTGFGGFLLALTYYNCVDPFFFLPDELDSSSFLCSYVTNLLRISIQLLLFHGCDNMYRTMLTFYVSRLWYRYAVLSVLAEQDLTVDIAIRFKRQVVENDKLKDFDLWLNASGYFGMASLFCTLVFAVYLYNYYNARDFPVMLLVTLFLILSNLTIHQVFYQINGLLSQWSMEIFGGWERCAERGRDKDRTQLRGCLRYIKDDTIN